MPVTEQTRTPITVEGIEWIPVTRPYDPSEGWVAKGFTSFTVAYYGDGCIFSGWCALEVGCGIGVKDAPDHEAAMRRVAPRIRRRAEEELARATDGLADLKTRCEAIGVTTA